MDRLAEMETFVRVIDAGSFSAAARLLEVGQPAVSKSVAHLEGRLGVRLLTRSTRGLTLTEAGKLFYERAKHVLDDVEEADLAARGASAGLSGHLRVSAAVTFARLHVVPRLPTFLAAHPDLSIDILLDDRSIDVVEEGIDVALRMGRVTSPSATARRLASSRRMVLASPVYLQRAGVPGDAVRPDRTRGHHLRARERGRDLELPPRFDGGLGRRDRSPSGERRRRRQGRGFGRDRIGGRLGVDVRGGADLRRTRSGAARVDDVPDGTLGRLSVRPPRQCEGARVRVFRQGGIA